MNERIKGMAIQSGLVYLDDGQLFSGWIEDVDLTEYLEEFAELIIRECIKSTLSLHNIAIDNQWDLDETFHVIVDTIVEDFDMQHIFRVEE